MWWWRVWHTNPSQGLYLTSLPKHWKNCECCLVTPSSYHLAFQTQCHFNVMVFHFSKVKSLKDDWPCMFITIVSESVSEEVSFLEAFWLGFLSQPVLIFSVWLLWRKNEDDHSTIIYQKLTLYRLIKLKDAVAQVMYGQYNLVSLLFLKILNMRNNSLQPPPQ